MSKKFPHYRQLHSSECGAVCLRMVARYYGRLFSTQQLKALIRQHAEGATLLQMSEAAEQAGLRNLPAKLSYARLTDDIPLPGIAHWGGNHFVVVYEAEARQATIGDPDATGIVTISKEDFLKNWTGRSDDAGQEGVMLLLEPSDDFLTRHSDEKPAGSTRLVWGKIKAYPRLLWFLAAGILGGALLAVTFPFILQLVVDESIGHQNAQLLRVVLVAWFVLFCCQLGLDFIRRFTLFHIGSKVNILLLTDFMKKILQLPAGFFQSRRTEDVMQTLYDNPKVQRFFTRELLSVVYASFLLLVFSLVLLTFSVPIFLVFAGTALLQGLCILYFLKKRKALNYRQRQLAAHHLSKMTDLIRGVRDIKLAHAEQTQRWGWERSEAHLYQVGRSLSLSGEISMQLPFFLGELRNIFIIYLAASAVIEGQMTIGVLVAAVYILLQLNNPLRQLIEFFIGWQETRMSLERMNEIHALAAGPATEKLDVLPIAGSLEGENVSFRYEGEGAPWVIRQLHFKIHTGKINVIVGPNGSGKSTLLNLLLNLHQPQEGFIKFGGLKLSEIQPAVWLARCGVAPQDGHIFHDSIQRNIALGDETIDSARLLEAARIAHILPFIERLPQGFGTLIGEGGTGLSRGQKQGILIARAVYRNPDFLFLDEATNDLDRESEQIVLRNIEQAFKGKTVVLSASRPDRLPIDYHHEIELDWPEVRHKNPGEFSSIFGGSAQGWHDPNNFKTLLQ